MQTSSTTAVAPASPAQPKLSATHAKLLSGYKPVQKTEEERKAEVLEGSALSTTVSLYEKFRLYADKLGQREHFLPRIPEAFPNDADLLLLQSINCTQEDLVKFLISLRAYARNKDFAECGIFISALLNASSHDNFMIDIKSMLGDTPPINYLGYKNSKSITINGNVGGNAAASAESATTTINGSAGANAGTRMRSGSARIVNGNCAKEAGELKNGGDLYIGGEIESLGDKITGGNIYHKGRRIVMDGVRLEE